ncbi:hypothetical protein [Caproicibacterium sp. BJN0003]|nr:hypothetical protein [Caproicibacterium sp. BJN0003]UZT81539.1 hypothetical protein OP489_08515 [Caproicibacterium sp. BJN0003]UZT81544.1 hypothetical protein OP489_08540 [Caproicibacterium sp. BJN0003]
MKKQGKGVRQEKGVNPMAKVEKLSEDSKRKRNIFVIVMNS